MNPSDYKTNFYASVFLNCIVCKRDAKQKCPLCSITRYCSRDHQLVHWAAHKVHCLALRQEVEQRLAASPCANPESDEARQRIKEEMAVVYWERLVAERQDPEALYNLGMCYARGEGGKMPSLRKGVQYISAAVRQGHAAAQHTMGTIYYNQAMKLGDRDRSEPGEHYCSDDKFEQARNFKSAADLFRLAAEQGDVPAMFYLARSYKNGQGVEKDCFEAVRWLRHAAKHNDLVSQKLLAHTYFFGMGDVPADEAESVTFLRLAAQQGAPVEQYILAFCYKHGRGVAKDIKQCFHWLRQAAEKGLVQAIFQISEFYYDGTCVKKDVEEARRLLSFAAAKGHRGAKHVLSSWGTELMQWEDMQKSDERGIHDRSPVIFNCRMMQEDLGISPGDQIIYN